MSTSKLEVFARDGQVALKTGDLKVQMSPVLVLDLARRLHMIATALSDTGDYVREVSA